MRKLQLTGGKWALVDDDDFWNLAQYNWAYKQPYAVRRISPHRKSKRVYLHREIMNPPKGKVVDHINGDPLDNCRFNMRIVSIADNVANRHGVQKNNTSGYRGVQRDHGGWVARVMVNRKSYQLGRFDSPEEASEVVELFWRKRLEKV